MLHGCAIPSVSWTIQASSPLLGLRVLLTSVGDSVNFSIFVGLFLLLMPMVTCLQNVTSLTCLEIYSSMCYMDQRSILYDAIRKLKSCLTLPVQTSSNFSFSLDNLYGNSHECSGHFQKIFSRVFGPPPNLSSGIKVSGPM